MRLTLFILAFWPFAAVANVESSPLVVYVESGVACQAERIGSVPAPNSVAGESYLITGDVQFISHEHMVPAVIGVSMGLKVTVSVPGGLDGVLLSVTHPPMGPQQVRRQTFVGSISDGAASQRFYSFDYDYELLPGTWTLEAKHGKELIYRATFEVVPPEVLPDLASACGYEDLFS